MLCSPSASHHDDTCVEVEVGQSAVFSCRSIDAELVHVARLTISQFLVRMEAVVMTASAAAARIPATVEGQITVMSPVLVVEEGLGPLQDVGGAEGH